MQKLIKVLPWGVIVVLLFLLFLGRCNEPVPEQESRTTIITRWIPRPTETIDLPQEPDLVHEEKKSVPPVHIPSANCDSLKGQYNYLAQNYFASRVFHRTLKKDSIQLQLWDTVSNNRLIGSKAVWDVWYPVNIITTETKTTLPPRRQLYIGGGAGTDLQFDNLYLKAGLLYKNRKDNMFGFEAMTSNKGGVIISGQSYFKIDLRRKP